MRVAAAQNLTGIPIVVPLAAVLRIRVDDPGKILTQSIASALAPAIDSQLDLIVRAPNQMIHRMALSSQDASGRNYAMAIPLATALSISAKNRAGTVLDQAGKLIQSDLSVIAAKGVALAPIRMTIQK